MPSIQIPQQDHSGIPQARDSGFTSPVFDALFLSRFPDLDAAEFSKLLRLAARTETLARSEALSVVDREDWPALCEDRVKRGLAAVRAVVQSGGDAAR